jgi:hypothetical protein
LRLRRGGWSWGPVEGAKLRVLSLGLGVQSTTLALMAAHGEIDGGPLDCAIVADFMDDEPGWTRETLAFLQSANVKLPFPVHLVKKGDGLSAALRARATGDRPFVAAPFFTANGGMGKRYCTREFKVEPITKKQRELLGYRPRQRIPPRSCEIWIGISTDEVVRAGPAFDRWAVNRYPLLEKRMSRDDCERWLERNGYPAVKKSACVFCPYRSDAEWRDLRDNDPEAFAKACEIDRLIRSAPGMRHASFVHSSRLPLAESPLSRGGGGQGMLELCEGACGV